MTKVKVWDPVVRAFHWTVAVGFAANALLTDAEGKLHEWIGYAIFFLVCLRILWGLTGTRHARFADFPPSVEAAVAQLSDMAAGRNHPHVGHSPLGAWMIYNLLLSLIAICVTGYMMTTDTFFGIGWVEEAHEILVTWAEVSVLAHIAGAVYESRRLGINLPKSMVTGYKEMP
ncbi:cytochrome b/b6 domain-containing protein [Albidovulum sediminicola]|uniref:Cytochrome b/b6 domain-containing protein n=1 Tax=Albidovulum sediminicola TaxID=2984331 RepID=A0ABT2Z3T5_9RHOB|nr:cytochrome b/b6 domain-containing protein [Defluviimonas sp. WL0075]MCV2865767.1 cytochrome b/b6 domain-containing protein [Defluviimonas sp. WL0075]